MRSKQAALVAALIGAVLVMIALDREPRKDWIVMQKDEKTGREHYAQGQKFATAGDAKQAVHHFEKALEHFDADSGMGKACRALLKKLQEEVDH